MSGRFTVRKRLVLHQWGLQAHFTGEARVSLHGRSRSPELKTRHQTVSANDFPGLCRGFAFTEYFLKIPGKNTTGSLIHVKS